jgi:large subunit ribosomal protein L30
MAKQGKQLEVTLKRSFHGRKPGPQECVFGLGIRRMHQTVTVADTPENRGMINRVYYLVDAKEV